MWPATPASDGTSSRTFTRITCTNASTSLPSRTLRTIAIDEFYAGRKTGYYTFVLDLVSGAIVHVGRGKDADALKPFWRRLRNHKDNIVAVAMDMSRAYISAVKEHLPNAAIVFDPFHVVKLMNEK